MELIKEYSVNMRIFRGIFLHQENRLLDIADFLGQLFNFLRQAYSERGGEADTSVERTELLITSSISIFQNSSPCFEFIT